MRMPTGIGVTAHVPEVRWVVENPNYPAEPKYVGELVTSTGEEQRFVSDCAVGPELEELRIVGRLVDTQEGRLIQITEVFDSG
mgnify:CR=1 FL=1